MYAARNYQKQGLKGIEEIPGVGVSIAEKLKNVFGYDLKYQNYNLTSQYKEQANSIYNSAIERFERLLKSGIRNLKKRY